MSMTTADDDQANEGALLTCKKYVNVYLIITLVIVIYILHLPGPYIVFLCYLGSFTLTQ